MAIGNGVAAYLDSALVAEAQVAKELG